MELKEHVLFVVDVLGHDRRSIYCNIFIMTEQMNNLEENRCTLQEAMQLDSRRLND